MLINKKNIETNHSIKIGVDNHDHLLKMRIDKLTIVTTIITKKSKMDIYRKLSILCVAKNKHYKIVRKRLRYKNPYNKSLKISYKKRNQAMLLHISYEPKHQNIGELRMDFRPQNFKYNEMNDFVNWLKVRLGCQFKESISNAWLTQVDVALDIYNCKLNDYIWGFKRSGKNKCYDTKNGLPGIKMGSSRSKLHALCYEKIDATKLSDTIKITKAKFINLSPSKHSHFLRIEMRFRPNMKPKETSSNTGICDTLLRMENVFQRIQVYSKEIIPILIEDEFIKIEKNESSIVTIKNKILKETGSYTLPRKYKRIIKKYNVNLFDINAIWREWHQCVSHLGNAL